MPFRALRGATTIDADTPEQITQRVQTLVRALFDRNGLSPDNVVSVVVTATNDIHSAHPATAVRRCGLEGVPILGARELDIVGGLGLCVRLLVHLETERPRDELRHVFLEGAVVLRPDLVAGNG